MKEYRLTREAVMNMPSNPEMIKLTVKKLLKIVGFDLERPYTEEVDFETGDIVYRQEGEFSGNCGGKTPAVTHRYIKKMIQEDDA